MNARARLRRLLPYVIAASGGFLLAYLIVAFVIFPSEIVPDDIKVPDVVGISAERAAMALERVGLEAAEGERRLHPSAPAGTVLAQSPLAGAVERKGARVRLDVSAGQRYVAVPALAGMTREEAVAALDAVGLSTGSVVQRSDPAPRGQVVEAAPGAGTRVVSPSRVDLVLSAGPSSVAMPDLMGRSYEEARSMVEQLGLRIGRVTIDSLAYEPFNTVIYQLPSAGQQVGNGYAVTLTISGTPQ